MPRYTLHRSMDAEAAQTAMSTGSISRELRADARLKLIGELPRMLLIECQEGVAKEWIDKLPGWILQPERKAEIPDSKQKLKKLQ